MCNAMCPTAQRAAAAEAENERLRKALRWYSSVGFQLQFLGPKGMLAKDLLLNDEGYIARAALQEAQGDA